VPRLRRPIIALCALAAVPALAGPAVDARGAAPRLELTYRADRPTVPPGGRVRFTATVRARGTGEARGVRVCVSLPPGLSAARTPAGERESARACFSIRRLAGGGSRSFSLLAIADRKTGPRAVRSVATLEGYGPRRRAGAVVAILTSASAPPAVTG
jgi:uncharacterized repeat protein (TIGR01451 family)